MPRLVRLTRGRLLLGLTIIVLLGLAVWAAYRVEQRSSRGLFWDKYQRIRLGMKYEEVEAIIGRPSDLSIGSWPPGTSWAKEKQVIAVEFSSAGAETKTFYLDRESEWARDPPLTWQDHIDRILQPFGLQTVGRW